MNQLTKLIEQCCEEKGLPSFMVKGLIKEVENEKGTWLNTLLEWLASRPTCTATERKFLDRGGIKLLTQGLSYIEEAKEKHYKNTNNSLVDDWIQKVKKLVNE